MLLLSSVSSLLPLSYCSTWAKVTLPELSTARNYADYLDSIDAALSGWLRTNGVTFFHPSCDGRGIAGYSLAGVSAAGAASAFFLRAFGSFGTLAGLGGK